MPIYPFHCEACDAATEEFRHMSKRDEPETCECGATMKRVLTVPRLNTVTTKKGMDPKAAVKRFLKEDRCHYQVPGGEKVVFKGPKSGWRRQAYNAQVKTHPNLPYNKFHLLNY